MTIDPLAEIVSFLQPSASYSKLVDYAGRWRIRRDVEGKPVFFAVLAGTCRVISPGRPPLIVREGDFVLSPSTSHYTIESLDAPLGDLAMRPVQISDGRFRVGESGAAVNLRMQVGLCDFASPDAALLVSLLPAMIVTSGEQRLVLLLQLVADETRQSRPGREPVLARLLEVLLIEALRSGTDMGAAPSLARGLADQRLAAALRAIHGCPAQAWTVGRLAGEAGLSRSAFFARFERVVGQAPIAYLLAWRMALAKRLLRTRELSVERIAAEVGYGSASTFNTAFTRHAGISPMRYAKELDPAFQALSSPDATSSARMHGKN